MLSLPSPWALMSGPLTLLSLLLSLLPHEATTRASATTPRTTHAASRALRLVSIPLFIRTPLLFCRNDTGVFTIPNQRDLPSPKRLGVLEARLRVLPDNHQFTAAVERDHEARHGPCIQAVADGS